MRPNASQSLNGSDWIRMGRNTSESLEKLAKTSKNLVKASKKIVNISVMTFFTAQQSNQMNEFSLPSHLTRGFMERWHPCRVLDAHSPFGPGGPGCICDTAGMYGGPRSADQPE